MTHDITPNATAEALANHADQIAGLVAQIHSGLSLGLTGEATNDVGRACACLDEAAHVLRRTALNILTN